MRGVRCGFTYAAIVLAHVLALCAMTSSDCTSEQPDPGSEHDEEIAVMVGDEFTVSRGANPSTGYEWKLEYNSEDVELVSRQFVPDTNLIGSPGVETFKFRALREGATVITMLHKRSWEKQTLNEQTILVTISSQKTKEDDGWIRHGCGMLGIEPFLALIPFYISRRKSKHDTCQGWDRR